MSLWERFRICLTCCGAGFRAPAGQPNAPSPRSAAGERTSIAGTARPWRTAMGAFLPRLLVVCVLVSSGSPAAADGAGGSPLLVGIAECQIVPGGTVLVPVGMCVDLHLFVRFPEIPFTFDVTDFTRFSVDQATDPEGCLVVPDRPEDVQNLVINKGPLPPTVNGRFCVRADAPASCLGKPIVVRARFEDNGRICETTVSIMPADVNLNQVMVFQVTGEGLVGSRLYPPDNELKQITIRPFATDPRFADAVVRLVSVQSTSGGDGTQPEFEILDAISDPASPEIVLLLRAALNRFGLPRFYYLTFEATTPGGLAGVGRVIIDTSVFFPRRGGFFIFP